MKTHYTGLTISLIPLLPLFISAAISSPTEPSSLPSEAAARQNAHQVFNAVHSALRQWGSSLKHNGMSFFPATVPEGNVLYHGAWSAERPRVAEWLAFEIEHAAMFAPSLLEDPRKKERGRDEAALIDVMVQRATRTIQAARRGTRPGADRGDDAQKPLGGSGDKGEEEDDDDGDDDDRKRRPPFKLRFPLRGYLHAYRATRPLNLLYIDGMAAGNSLMGTLDSQDHLLLNRSTYTSWRRAMEEFERADDLCDLARGWSAAGGARIDGFVRMEAGFEVIYCDFGPSAGLDLVSLHGAPFSNESAASARPYDNAFEWIYAVSQRYHGLPRSRVWLDFSGMVSAFFYPFNITNPDTERPELPRVVNMTGDEWGSIRGRVREVANGRPGDVAKKLGEIEWQDLVDLIVSRYEGRLTYLVEKAPSAEAMLSDLNSLLNPFIDYTAPDPAGSALEQCTHAQLHPAAAREASWTPEDRALYAAISTVTRDICSTLIDVRKALEATAPSHDGSDSSRAVATAKRDLRELEARLAWTTWKECGACALGEVCFVAMFPFGSAEDHFQPRCKGTMAMIRDPWLSGGNYWRPKGMS